MTTGSTELVLRRARSMPRVILAFVLVLIVAQLSGRSLGQEPGAVSDQVARDTTLRPDDFQGIEKPLKDALASLLGRPSADDSYVVRSKRSIALSVVTVMLAEEALRLGLAWRDCLQAGSDESEHFAQCMADRSISPGLLRRLGIDDICPPSTDWRRITCVQSAEVVARGWDVETRFSVSQKTIDEWGNEQQDLYIRLYEAWARAGQPDLSLWHQMPEAIELANFDSLEAYVLAVRHTAFSLVNRLHYLLLTSAWPSSYPDDTLPDSIRSLHRDALEQAEEADRETFESGWLDSLGIYKLPDLDRLRTNYSPEDWQKYVEPGYRFELSLILWKVRSRLGLTPAGMAAINLKQPKGPAAAAPSGSVSPGVSTGGGEQNSDIASGNASAASPSDLTAAPRRASPRIWLPHGEPIFLMALRTEAEQRSPQPGRTVDPEIRANSNDSVNTTPVAEHRGGPSSPLICPSSEGGTAAPSDQPCFSYDAASLFTSLVSVAGQWLEKTGRGTADEGAVQLGKWFGGWNAAFAAAEIKQELERSDWSGAAATAAVWAVEEFVLVPYALKYCKGWIVVACLGGAVIAPEAIEDPLARSIEKAEELATKYIFLPVVEGVIELAAMREHALQLRAARKLQTREWGRKLVERGVPAEAVGGIIDGRGESYFPPVDPKNPYPRPSR